MTAVRLFVTLITTDMVDADIVVFVFGQKSLFWTYGIDNALYWCMIYFSNQRSRLVWWKFCRKHSKGCRNRVWQFWRKIHAGCLIWYQNHRTMWTWCFWSGYSLTSHCVSKRSSSSNNNVIRCQQMYLSSILPTISATTKEHESQQLLDKELWNNINMQSNIKIPSPTNAPFY